MEPIRQVAGDGARERATESALRHIKPEWKLYPTPRFYFSDYHINHDWGNGRENYIGDLEVKWLRSEVANGAVFPFQKLQKLMIAPPHTEGFGVFHRILFRFSDNAAIIPVKELAALIPRWHIRGDTQERDLVVDANYSTLQPYLLNTVITE